MRPKKPTGANLRKTPKTTLLEYSAIQGHTLPPCLTPPQFTLRKHLADIAFHCLLPLRKRCAGSVGLITFIPLVFVFGLNTASELKHA